jgi:hypothetical protein
VLRDGQRTMPRGWAADARSQQANLILVDGYEQLAYWQRLLFRATCRLHGWGLLVTAHSDVGFPTLYQTTASLAVTVRVVDALLKPEVGRLAPEQVAAAYHAAGGDVRETLFRLYDVWEARSQSAAH